MFRTNTFSSGKGFNITYMPQDNSSICLLGQKQCRNRKCVEQSVVCDGNDDCEDGSDEEKCPGMTFPTTECGRPEIEPITFSDLDRIVGGREADYGSWPWMASLQAQSMEPDGHLCGGSLINAQWVLTASHCFEDKESWNTSYWRIHLGMHHKSVKDPYEQIRYAERIIIFPDFPPEEFEKHGGLNLTHDLALIKLNAPVQFTKYVKPVCLADPKLELNSASNCYAAGWGQTRGSGSSDELKQSLHPVQPAKNCEKYIKGVFDPINMICAGSMGPLNGVCHGDSGGPLVCRNESGTWSIVGVASYVTDSTGEGLGLCGLEGRPTVFNRVYLVNDWIYEIVDHYS